MAKKNLRERYAEILTMRAAIAALQLEILRK